MKHLDLFSGIGGFSLGLEAAGMETVAFCEIEPFCQKVLRKHWPDVPIYDDVKELTNERLRADGITDIDVISGGFPCQDLSVCGYQEGINADRSGLWSEIARLVGEIRPRYAIVENVTALISGDSGRWFGKVLGDLAEIGYDAEWDCIQPAHVGIPSARDRVWICAYPAKEHVEEVVDKRRLSFKPGGMGADHLSRTGWSVDSSRMGRGINGVPDDVDRFESLGNAVVPQVVEQIGRAIMECEK